MGDARSYPLQCSNLDLLKTGAAVSRSASNNDLVQRIFWPVRLVFLNIGQYDHKLQEDKSVI